MTEKKSMIEEVVEEREGGKKKSGKRVFKEEREKRPPEVEKKLPAQIATYISSVYSIMNERQPDYNPLGYYTGDRKWETNISFDRFYTYGDISAGLLKTTLSIRCSYTESTGVKNQVLQDAETSERNKQFVAQCYVVNDADDALVSFFKDFIHPNYSVHLYNIHNGEEELIFNESDKKAVLFSEWFKRDGKPRLFEDMVREIADEEGIFTRSGLKEKMDMKEKEFDRFLNAMIKRNVIIDMSEEEYAFV